MDEKITVEVPSPDALLESYKCIMQTARAARHLDAYQVQTQPDVEDVALNAKIVTPLLAVAEELWGRLTAEQQAGLAPPWDETGNHLLPDPHWERGLFV